MAKLTFVNDSAHPWITVHWGVRHSSGNITLRKGDTDEKDSGPNHLWIAWSLGNTHINDDQFGKYGVKHTHDATIHFSKNPAGFVPMP
ncbi:hypothetical protein ACFQ3P_38600 [Paraburkholderia sabiae]|uniref:Uncharacterized protein n=1 Tax=Paraburkholderia sabiae TaxID=273251 RepID=A0ABU9QPQ6_9BURK|nr:hypothetical protein [Paraburkholderia sabiae]WJZ74378.1 hypothetical protein QEN71_00755 [Paraburkholderia sabiae]CAD6562660.1 hypothetical protein LMG24235_07899 [Paraburkholderia sabiae]